MFTLTLGEHTLKQFTSKPFYSPALSVDATLLLKLEHPDQHLTFGTCDHCNVAGQPFTNDGAAGVSVPGSVLVTSCAGRQGSDCAVCVYL